MGLGFRGAEAKCQTVGWALHAIRHLKESKGNYLFYGF